MDFLWMESQCLLDVESDFDSFFDPGIQCLHGMELYRMSRSP